MSGADPIWLFDLDNTLHDASQAVFGRLNRSMTEIAVDHAIAEELERWADLPEVQTWLRAVRAAVLEMRAAARAAAPPPPPYAERPRAAAGN